MSLSRKNLLWAVFIVVLGCAPACNRKAKTQGGRPPGVMNCAAGQPIQISDPVSGQCDVDCVSKPISLQESVDWVAKNPDSTFDVAFRNSGKPKDSHCTPGVGNAFPPHVTVHGHGSGKPTKKGCYEYTISYNGTTCNDPNIIVR